MTARDDAATRRGHDAAGQGDPHAPRRGRLTMRQCHECGRTFDLLDEDDAAEWTYGHDCEDNG